MGQLVRVADEVETGDAGVLDPHREDTVEFPIDVQRQCGAAVDRGRYDCERDVALGEAADHEPRHLVRADDGPRGGLLDAAAVADRHHLGGEDVEQALQVSGLERAPERVDNCFRLAAVTARRGWRASTWRRARWAIWCTAAGDFSTAAAISS